MHDFSNLVVGSKLRRIIDLWPEVQNILGNSRLDSVVFTERVFENEKISLYLDDEDLGLWRPVEWSELTKVYVGNDELASEGKVRVLLRDMGTSNFAHDESFDPEGWVNYRILPSDYMKVIASAESIAGRVEEHTTSADYLDPNHPRYAPKLAAAVRAWQAVTDAGGKHPKQALAKWLRENAAEFGMTDDGGKPNETGIEEAAKVANWQPGGGAPKTPSE